MKKIVFDTNAIKAVFINEEIRDKFVLFPEKLLLEPYTLKREFYSPSIAAQIYAKIGEENYLMIHDAVWSKIILQEKSKVKKNLDLAKEIFKKFKLPPKTRRYRVYLFLFISSVGLISWIFALDGRNPTLKFEIIGREAKNFA